MAPLCNVVLYHLLSMDYIKHTEYRILTRRKLADAEIWFELVQHFELIVAESSIKLLLWGLPQRGVEEAVPTQKKTSEIHMLGRWKAKHLSSLDLKIN